MGGALTRAGSETIIWQSMYAPVTLAATDFRTGAPVQVNSQAGRSQALRMDIPIVMFGTKCLDA